MSDLKIGMTKACGVSLGRPLFFLLPERAEADDQTSNLEPTPQQIVIVQRLIRSGASELIARPVSCKFA